MGLPCLGKASFCRGFLLPLLWVLLLGSQKSVDWNLTAISGTSLCFHPWQSSKEDTTSSISSGSPGGNHSSLHSLYTSMYKDWISSLLVWGPISWMADMSASGSSFGNLCQWPWQTIHSTLLLPLVCCMLEHFVEHYDVVGAILPPT